MKKILFLILLVSGASTATMPATRVPLGASNIEQYGFKVEIKTSKETTSLSLIAPPIISTNWRLVGTQAYSYMGSTLGMLTKSSVPMGSEPVNLTVFYETNKLDAFVGVYYQCVATSELGCSANQEKLFYIESVNSYISTK
jgi:hypothetical protein